MPEHNQTFVPERLAKAASHYEALELAFGETLHAFSFPTELAGNDPIEGDLSLVIRDMLAATTTDPAERKHLEQSLSGKLGSANRPGVDVAGIVARVVQKCASEPKFDRLIEHPNFTSYLEARARTVVARRIAAQRE